MTQKYRKGDIVTVQAVVETVWGEDVAESIRNSLGIRIAGQSPIYVKPDVVTLITPFFAAGERVQKKEAKGVRGTVVAMNDDVVWVKFDHGTHGTVPAVDLEPSTALRAVA